MKGTRGKSQSQGRCTAIPTEEEKMLANGLKTLEKWGWGLSRKEVLELVGCYVRRNNIDTPFKDGIPGKDWFIGFKKRHRLSIKKPQTLEYARKKAGSDPFIIEGYFDLLQKTLIDLDLVDKPKQIFNIDETSFALDPTKTKVVGQKNAPSSRVTAGPARESTTVLMGGNADGQKLPPLIVFKGKNIWDTWMAPSTPGVPETCYAASSNGWMESDIFSNYFQKTFLTCCGSDRPILLIYDGHTTHVDERVIQSAIDNNITIMKLPPHSSHILQPMDLAVFKSLKSAWDQKLARYQRHQQGVKISKRDFSVLLTTIWNETPPALLKAGFQKAGILPYNRGVVNINKYDPEAYKRYLSSKNNRPAPDTVATSPTTTTAPLGLVAGLTAISTSPAVEGEGLCAPYVQPGTRTAPTSDMSLMIETTLDLSHAATPSSSNSPCCSKNIQNKSYNISDESFESLLLETVRQNTPPSRTKKRRIARGAEIITAQEYANKLEEQKTKDKGKEKQTIKTGKGKRLAKPNKKGNSQLKTNKTARKFGEIIKIGNKKRRIKVEPTSDEDESDISSICSIESKHSDKFMTIEDLRKEMLEEYAAEEKDEDYYQPKDKVSVGHWVLVRFDLKQKKNVHFVGQVTNFCAGEDPEVIFLRKHKTTKQGTTFLWPESRDVTQVPSEDIVTVLPEPKLGRRGELTFEVSFDSYIIQ